MKQLLVFLALVTLVFCQCTSTKCSDCISNTSCVYCVGSAYSSCQASSTVCSSFLYTSNITNGGTCPPSCADPTNCGQCTSGVYVTAGCVWCNNSYSSCTQNTSCPAVVGNPISNANCPAVCQVAPPANASYPGPTCKLPANTMIPLQQGAFATCSQYALGIGASFTNTTANCTDNCTLQKTSTS